MILHPRTLHRIGPFILCLVLLWAITAQAGEAPPIRVGGAVPAVEIASQSEYLLDYSGRLQYQDILSSGQPFQRHTKYSFQFSFKRATLWFKCRIAPADSGDETALASRRSFLVFDNAALGAVTLYVPVILDGKPDLIEFHGGWRQGEKSREFPFLYPTFVLPDNLDASRPVVVRVATPYALQFRATLYTIDAFRKMSFVLFLIVGFFAGILIAMILYNLALYLFIRDRQYLFYITYIGFLLLWQCVLVGLFQYIWPPLGAFLMSGIPVFAALMMIFAVSFGIVFLNVLVEQLGAPIPAYPVLVVTGALEGGSLARLGWLTVIAVAAALIADVLWYQAGRAYGHRVLGRICRISLSPDACIRQTESVYGRWGAKSLLVAKFVPGFASIASALAGVVGTPLRIEMKTSHNPYVDKS